MTALTVLCAAVAMWQPAPTAPYRERFPLPTPTVPSGWGSNIHFTDALPGEWDIKARSGMRWIRMDLFWHDVERVKGQYDFSGYDRLMEELRRRNLRPLLILDYGNDHYEKGAPKTPEARRAFVSFVRAAVRRYAGRGVLWEIWNEPNGKFWEPAANVDQYLTLARETATAIREEAPEEWVAFPALAGFDWPFIERLFQGGLLELCDAVTIHPYRPIEPESAFEDWARLRGMIDRYAPRGKFVPMISGEWGYSDITLKGGRDQQALYAARQYLSNLTAGVNLSIWYDWRNDGTDPKEPEHHFGLIDHALNLKPAFGSVQQIVRHLVGFQFDKRLDVDDDGVWCLLFQKGNSVRVVAWCARPTPQRVTLPLGEGEFRVIRGNRTGRIRSRGAGATVTLDGTPTIYIPDGPNPILLAAARWPKLPPFLTVRDGDALRRAVEPVYRGVWSSVFPNLSRVVVEDQPGDESLNRAFVKTVEDADDTGSAPIDFDALPRVIDRSPGAREVKVAVRLKNGPKFVQRMLVYPFSPIRAEVVGLDDKLSLRLTREYVDMAERFGVAVLSPGAAEPANGRGLPTVELSGRASTTVALDAPKGPFRVILYDSGDRPVLRTNVFQPVPISISPTTVAWGLEGDEKVLSEVAGTHEPDGILKTIYRFGRGWRYYCVYARGPLAEPLPGTPQRLGLWVEGDGSGNMLRMRFVDKTGQTFQPDFGVIDWRGWRFVSVPLTGVAAGRWGGANDGVVHYPIRIETLALVDNLRGNGGEGIIRFRDPLVLTTP